MNSLSYFLTVPGVVDDRHAGLHSSHPSSCMLEDVYRRRGTDPTNGMQTSVWGPLAWNYLHTMSFNFPHDFEERSREEQDRIERDHVSFFEGMCATVPCGKCRENLKQNLIEINYDQRKEYCFRGRYEFSKLCYDLHTKVNELLKKPYFGSYKDAAMKYEQYRATSCSSSINHNKNKIADSMSEKKKKTVSFLDKDSLSSSHVGCVSTTKPMTCTVVVEEKVST